MLSPSICLLARERGQLEAASVISCRRCHMSTFLLCGLRTADMHHRHPPSDVHVRLSARALARRGTITPIGNRAVCGRDCLCHLEGIVRRIYTSNLCTYALHTLGPVLLAVIILAPFGRIRTCICMHALRPGGLDWMSCGLAGSLASWAESERVLRCEGR